VYLVWLPALLSGSSGTGALVGASFGASRAAVLPGGAGCQRFFHSGTRALTLAVVIGSFLDRQLLVTDVNQVGLHHYRLVPPARPEIRVISAGKPRRPRRQKQTPTCGDRQAFCTTGG